MFEEGVSYEICVNNMGWDIITTITIIAVGDMVFYNNHDIKQPFTALGIKFSDSRGDIYTRPIAMYLQHIQSCGWIVQNQKTLEIVK